MLLRLRLHLCAIIIVTTISIEIVRVIVGRGIICRDGRWHGFSHVASIRCRITILLAGRLQRVWLWCGRNVIIVQQLWCFRVVLQDIIGWIDKARWYETLLSVTAHNPKPFGIFSVQNCLQNWIIKNRIECLSDHWPFTHQSRILHVQPKHHFHHVQWTCREQCIGHKYPLQMAENLAPS